MASNGNVGVSLFEADDPETYRSTYDILHDIADIWNELTDKNQAQLLEVLFGKRQGQVGSAILSNFESAESAIEKMADATGNADAEMEKITQSLEYKLNALKETWVGVAQNLFQTDDLKIAVAGLSAFSAAIDNLTQSLGLFGTVGLVTAISLLFKFRSTIGSLHTTVLPVVDAIKASGMAMNGSAASVQFLASKLVGLDKAQQAAVMSALGLTVEQKKQVASMNMALAASQKYTIKELAKAASTDKDTASTLANNMAKSVGKRKSEQLTAAMTAEILNSKRLTAAQKQSILSTLEQTAANQAQALSWRAVGANAKAALAAMATNPMTWVMAATAAVMGLVQAFRNHKQEQEEARQAASEAAGTYNEMADSISDYKEKIIELRAEIDAGNLSESDAYAKRKELLGIQQELIDKFGEEAEGINLVTGAVNEQIDSLDLLTKKKWEQFKQENTGAIEDAIKTFTNFQQTDLGWDHTNGLDVYAPSAGSLWQGIKDLKLDITPKDFHDALQKEIENAGLEIEIPVSGITGDFTSDTNLSNAEEYVEYYQKLYQIVESLGKEYFGIDQYMAYTGDALDAYSKKITDLNDHINENKPAWDTYVRGMLLYEGAYDNILTKMEAAQKSFRNALADEDYAGMGDALDTMDALQQQWQDAEWGSDAANKYIQDFLDTFDRETQSSKLKIQIEAELDSKSTSDILEKMKTEINAFADDHGTVDVTKILDVGTKVDAAGLDVGTDEQEQSYIRLRDYAEQYGIEVSELLSILTEYGIITDSTAQTNDLYSAKLSNLSDVISDLKSSYDALDAAQEDMSSNKGLSPETIEKLADAEGDYLAYLYEENGVVKLNTEVWKENANAKMLGEIEEIQKEIGALEQRNKTLRETVDLLKQQANSGSSDNWYQAGITSQIAAASREIEANSQAIAENQGKLAIYSSLYGSVTGDMNAYASALQNFSTVANTIDSMTGSFQTLANLQAEVANGFTMSLDKALEFAKVYPEIMNNAQVAADGQITLNQDVVNSFINGKKAELDAQIDAKIAELEGDKAAFQAKIEAAQAQLDLAKAVAEGEGGITKELAEYRINAGNIVAQALIAAGIDEATAFKLAASAMAQNAEEFDRVAMEVCTDVNGNFNKAAYSAAQGIYNNMKRAKMDVASFAKQCQLAAAAMAGVAGGDVAGSAEIQGGSGGGVGGGGISLNLTSGSFQGTDYTYTAKETNIEDFISQIELDIADYQGAIAQIDGQIAALQALKNTPLKSFADPGKGGSGKGSGKGSGDGNKKEVEAYIASIDEFRDAVERLRKAQEEAERIETAVENATSYEKKIALQKELVDAYREEQGALHALNNARDATIAQSAASLRALGFEVSYNADTNDLWISNMEHLNELTADSTGKYDTLQEATNALRKETEELIQSVTDLNDSNREGSATWHELNRSIIETTVSMYENAVQAKENAIMLAENGMENAVSTKMLSDVKKFSAAMIAGYQDIQKIIQQEADYYRSLGYAETSDEISKLSDSLHDYADHIKDVKQQVIDYLLDITEAAHNAVDEIQDVLDTLQQAADEFAANDGFITIDTYQAILKLGPQYMQMLKDENGLLQINEERINDVIAARTQQMAVENAMAYVERLKLAAQQGSIEDLNSLVFATNGATSATWGLVYAELELMRMMGDLNDSQYQAALHNIQTMQDLADNVINNIDKAAGSVAKNLENMRKQLEDTLDELEEMQDGADNLVDYVMDMLKHRIQQQVDLLEEMKDKYSELINLKKESLDTTKDEQDYQKSIAKKLREMANLQERINALSLDDSRSAQAERAKLLEEMAELQDDLADTQADKSIETQKEALDKMEEDYHAEKDEEIKILEESISSTQKLYDMAIAYIRDNWDTLYTELIEWNTEYGSVFNTEITAAWEAAQAAAQRYGDFVTAIMGGISAEIDSITRQIEELDAKMDNLDAGGNDSSSSGGNKNTTVGVRGEHDSPSSEDIVRAAVGRMKEYAAQWSADSPNKEDIHQKAEKAYETVAANGVKARFSATDGTWVITEDKLNPGNVGKLLYNCYHTGGLVGDDPLKPNERYIKAENGELVMTASQQDSLVGQLDRISTIADALINAPIFSIPPVIGGGLSQDGHSTINNIANNSRPIEIRIGDTVIQGNASAETVAAHSKVTEKMVNELARMVGVKW